MIKEWFKYKAAQYKAKAARAMHTARLYEAAKPSEFRSIPSDKRSAAAVTEHTGDKLRRWARYLDENSDLVTGIFDDLTLNTVGGLQVEPMVVSTTGKEKKKTNEQLAEDWALFAERPTLDGKHSLQKTVNLMARTYWRDGEILARHAMGNSFDHPNGAVPYSFIPLEPDYLPFEFTDDKLGVIHGIQYKEFNQEAAFWLYKSHPGGNLITFPNEKNLTQFDAQVITHVPFCKRLHAGRGVPIIHAVVTRLDDIKDLEESERIRARWAAMQIGAIHRDETYEGNEEENAAGMRVFDSDIGTIYDNFRQGEKLQMFESNTPNEKLPDHLKDQNRRVAAGSRSMYSNIARDYSGSYSSQRQELVTHVLYRYDAQADFNGHMIRRAIWRNFVDAEIAYNRIRIDRTTKLSSLYDPIISVFPPPWIDPTKETDAQIKQNEAGLKPKSYIIRDMGNNPRQVAAELEREREAEAKLTKGNDNGQDQDSSPGDNPSGDAESGQSERD